jgi:hypothetical protein
MGAYRQTVEVREDQTFALLHIADGAYRFRVFPQLPNHYLKSARVQGKDVLDQAFEIRSGEKVTGAEIVLSADGGSIDGPLKQPESEQIPRGATVVLFSADVARREPDSRWTRTAQCDQQGNYRLTGIAPGDYLICALQNHEPGAETSIDYLQALEKSAKSVSVQPHSRLTESLVVMQAPVVD